MSIVSITQLARIFSVSLSQFGVRGKFESDSKLESDAVEVDNRCKVCGRVGIQCEGRCGRWFHQKCSGLSVDEFKELSVGKLKLESWVCNICESNTTDG